jgi:hypothetical protein
LVRDSQLAESRTSFFEEKNLWHRAEPPRLIFL